MTAKDYIVELERGNLGQIEYHLHKDGSWIAEPFKSLEDQKKKIDKLVVDEYKIDRVVYFATQLHYLENPKLSVFERFEYLKNYVIELSEKEQEFLSSL